MLLLIHPLTYLLDRRENFNLARYLSNGRTELDEVRFECAMDTFMHLCLVEDELNRTIEGLGAHDDRRALYLQQLLHITNLREVWDRERIRANLNWKRTLRSHLRLHRRALVVLPRPNPRT